MFLKTVFESTKGIIFVFSKNCYYSLNLVFLCFKKNQMSSLCRSLILIVRKMYSRQIKKRL